MKQSRVALCLFAAVLVGGSALTGCGKDAKVETDMTQVDTTPTTTEPATDSTWQEPEPTTPAEPEVISLSLSDIYFDYDRSELRADAKRVLDDNLAQLRARPDVRLVIEGHCDERGTVEYNLALGQRRAHATMNYLIRRGVDPSRVTVVSYGEERPADPRHTEVAYSKNRRAHFNVREG